MRRKNAASLIALALLVLILPGALSARNWRGAQLLVTGQDGRRVEGELMAVKPDTLVLLGADAKVESLPLAEIRTIRILRKSKAWQGLLGGFVAGAVGGAIWGGVSGHEEWGVEGAAFIGGLMVAVPASLVGLAGGMAAGLDDEIDIADLPEPEVERILAKLSRQAREPGAYVSRPSIRTAGEPGLKPAPSRYERTRFRLAWMPGYRTAGRGYSFGVNNVSFRFIGDLPPGEAGPYPVSSSYSHDDRPRFSFGRMTLAYAWSRQLGAEVEIYIPKRSTGPRAVSMHFTSTLDGLSYDASFGSFEDVSSTSLLVGLSYRPLRPSFLRPHAVELGVAAGPAWIRWKGGDFYNYDSYYWSDSRRIVTWTARVRFSYDYYLNPSFSMGAFAEYRRLRAGIPAYSRTEILLFYESTYPGGTLTRTTEVAFPGRIADAGGFAIGLRFGLGF